MLLAGCSVREQPEAVYADTEQRLMHQFCIAAAHNPQLKEDIQFEYDSVNRTFTCQTQQWIEGIDTLRPAFYADGEVYVNGKEQLTGITPCNFSGRVVEYTVRNTSQMTQGKYSVSIISPQTTGLPVLKIDIAGGRIVKDKEKYLPATYMLNVSGTTIKGALEIRGRGNSTWWEKKKPYKIKLSESAPLFGMHKARTWVLLANALDVTLLTNNVAFSLARKMQMPFTNHGQHVELYLNDKYEGNYFLTEQIDVHKGRVEVDTLKGGFLAEIDLNFDKEYKWTSSIYKLPVMLSKPENSIAMDELKSVFFKVERLLARPNPSFEKLSALIDMPSLVRYMILNELVFNIELGHPKSVFFYRKSSEAPLEWGPVWDFDWAFGYAGSNFVYFQNPDQLMFDITHQSGQMWGAGGTFFSRFLLMPEFCELYRQEWERVLPEVSDIGGYIWSQGKQLDYSWHENRKRWGAPDVAKQDSYMVMAGFINRRVNLISKTTRRQN